MRSSAGIILLPPTTNMLRNFLFHAVAFPAFS